MGGVPLHLEGCNLNYLVKKPFPVRVAGVADVVSSQGPGRSRVTRDDDAQVRSG